MKKILVGLDGSPRQEGVLSAASALAARTGAKLVLFRAVSLPVELPADAYRMAPSELPHVLEEYARAALARVDRVPTDMIESRHVAIGAPWQAICQAAIDHDVDIVVIGSHGYDTLDRLLGTTAAKVVNRADRSVLVVRGADRLA